MKKILLFVHLFSLLCMQAMEQSHQIAQKDFNQEVAYYKKNYMAVFVLQDGQNATPIACYRYDLKDCLEHAPEEWRSFLNCLCQKDQGSYAQVAEWIEEAKKNPNEFRAVLFIKHLNGQFAREFNCKWSKKQLFNFYKTTGYAVQEDAIDIEKIKNCGKSYVETVIGGKSLYYYPLYFKMMMERRLSCTGENLNVRTYWNSFLQKNKTAVENALIGMVKSDSCAARFSVEPIEEKSFLNLWGWAGSSQKRYTYSFTPDINQPDKQINASDD